MPICQACSADYEEHLRRCPHCGEDPAGYDVPADGRRQEPEADDTESLPEYGGKRVGPRVAITAGPAPVRLSRIPSNMMPTRSTADVQNFNPG